MTVKALFTKKGNVCSADFLLQMHKHTAELSRPGGIREPLCLPLSMLAHRSGPPPALQSKCFLWFVESQHTICHKRREITGFKHLKNEAPWFMLVYSEASHARVVFQDSATVDEMEAKREILHEAGKK